MSPLHKPLVWLAEVVKSPPLSHAARVDAGFMLRCLQQGTPLAMPHVRPMPSIGPRVCELRLTDGGANAEWRLIYRIDADAIVIVHVFRKQTQKTPKSVIELCQARLADYGRAGR